MDVSINRAADIGVYRILRRLGLKERLDSDSKRNELHPQNFRKYFFSKPIGAVVDRGIMEFFVGHSSGLYLPTTWPALPTCDGFELIPFLISQ
jgi:hypothetical protein